MAADINTDQSGHLSSAARTHTHTHSGRATQTLMQQWSGKRVKLIINAMANWRAEKEREQEQQQQEQQEQQSTTAFCAVDTLDSRIYAT